MGTIAVTTKDIDMVSIMNDYHSDDPVRIQSSKDRMIEALDGFIGHLIKKHFESFSGDHYCELYQEGVIGILESMAKFDPEKGKATTFFTAPIIHEMSRYCNMQTNKSSQYHSQIMNAVKKAINHFAVEGQEYNIADIILYTGLSAKKVQEALNRINAVNELYCEDSEAFDKALGKISDNPEDIIVKQDHDEALANALKQLDEIDRKILQLRYNDDKDYSYAAISRIVGIPINQVRTSIARSLKELAHDEHLLSYYSDRVMHKDQKVRNSIDLSMTDDINTLQNVLNDSLADDNLSLERPYNINSDKNDNNNEDDGAEYFLSFS